MDSPDSPYKTFLEENRAAMREETFPEVLPFCYLL